MFRSFSFLLALPLALLALSCSRHNSNEIRRAESLFIEAGREEQQFNYTKAEELYREAASLFSTNNEQALESDVYTALGAMNRRAGNFQLAVDNLTHATELAQNAADHSRHASALVAAAEIESELGLTDRAITLTQQSVTLSEMYAYPEGRINGNLSLGKLYRVTGHFRQAAECFSRARMEAQKLYKPAADLEAGFALCEVAIDERRYVDALQSLALLTPVVDTSAAAAHRWDEIRARALIGAGDYTQASEAFASAIEKNEYVPQKDQLRTLIGAARVYYLQRRAAQAEQLCSEALDLSRSIPDHIAEAMILVHLGDIRRQARSGNTDDLYRQAIEIFQGLEYPGGAAIALHHYGNAAEADGNLAEAADLYRKALDAYDDAIAHPSDLSVDPRLDWDQNHSSTAIASDLARSLLLSNRMEEAVTGFERGLLGDFAVAMQAINPIPRNESLLKQYERVRQLAGELRAFNRERAIEIGKPDEQRDEAKVQRLTELIRTETGEREKAILEIENAEPNASFTFSAKEVSLNDIQSHLPPGMILLEYIPAGIQLYCAIITQTSFSVRRLPASYPSILQHADEFRRILNESSIPRERALTDDASWYRVNALGRSLYNELLAPLQSPGFAQSDLAIVSPAGLSDIPFHALVCSGTEFSGEYVANRQSVRYLPFATAALFTSDPRRLLYTMVAIGNPDVTNWEVDYVLRDIRTFFKDAALFIGDDATPDNLIRSTGDVLHIATDFLYDANYVQNSYFLLRKPGGSVRVPLGSLHELYNFSCVILMNVGPSIESVNRFHMALLLANGTRCAIGTFWQPERGAVRAFDEQFYSSLANRMSPDAAYLQAEREMTAMPIFRPPHQWAPFYYYGIH